ncbi:MAG TPA: HlyD family type I secretion periplasmic adaptor subunit [Rhodocyclaceae bacterium]|nr:HlyD family type I secretion periplasmic adaptor subunit [Rhodocyclaceae bacterium]
MFDRLVNRADRHASHDDTDFEQDADWAIGEQTPRGARIGVWCAGIALLVAIIWSAFAQLDEVTRGEGKVIPSRQIQVVQSLDGGIVSQILVHEGQSVEAGQLLLKIDPTRFVSSLKENQSEYLSLLAKAARLRALTEGKPFVPPPEVVQQDPDIVNQERDLFESKRAELDANVAIARQQLTQRTQELSEVKAKQIEAAQSYDLTKQELDKTRPLLKTGAVSDVEILRLERDVSRYLGDRDQAAAQIPRIESSMAEAQHKIQEVELNFRNLASTDLSDTMSRLGKLSEGSVALADRVKQSDIRSPVKGTVKQLLFNTVGGVVQPGKDIVEVVPSDDALLLEARILPKDIAFLRPGQKALVKFTAYDFAIYGGLTATLEQIGADTITDEKGNAFYIVRVRTDKTSMGVGKLPIIPGMVAEVDILTGKKSILSYLMKPVLRAHANAMTER